jgi:glucose/arabinose dehydrogenase
MNLKQQIENIVKNGAAIVAFDYAKKDGTVSRRNGVVGYLPFGERAWGVHSSRSIVTSKNGEEFVTVKTNNDSGETAIDGHAYKSFNLAQISNFACSRGQLKEGL